MSVDKWHNNTGSVQNPSEHELSHTGKLVFEEKTCQVISKEEERTGIDQLGVKKKRNEERRESGGAKGKVRAKEKARE